MKTAPARAGVIAPLAIAGLVAAAVRVPFLASGIGQDEGGYAYIAREWARGTPLYHALWVDRPQGLLLAYRALLSLADRPWAIRLGAVLAGVAITVLLGVIGRLLVSPAAGMAAAGIYAIAGAGPHIEGFTFNGELAAAVPAAGAVACSLAWRRTCAWGWLFAAGVLGGAAVLMKQSGFDGMLVAAAVALASGGGAGRRARRAGLVLGGAALPIAASLIHGAATGWLDYAQAVFGYRASQDLGSRFGARPEHFALSWGAARADLLALACVAIAGIVVCLRRRDGAAWIAPLWLLAAVAGFNLGGLYWPHYYVQLVPPLALLAGIAVSAVPWRALSPALAVAAVAPVLVTLVAWFSGPMSGPSSSVPFAHSYWRDQAIAHFVRTHSTSTDAIYALSSEGDVYYLADRHAAFRYLWGHPLGEIRGALGGLRALLAGQARPKFVIVYRDPGLVDRSGALGVALLRNYRMVWRVPPRGVRVFEARRGA